LASLGAGRRLGSCSGQAGLRQSAFSPFFTKGQPQAGQASSRRG